MSVHLSRAPPAVASHQLDLSRSEQLCTAIDLQKANACGIQVVLHTALDAHKENADKDGQYQYRQWAKTCR